MESICSKAVEIERKIIEVANSDPYEVQNHHKQLHVVLINRIGIAKLYLNETDNDKKMQYYEIFMTHNENIKQFLGLI